MARALPDPHGEGVRRPRGCEVKLSYVQIYMEAIYDLLDPTSQVDLREDPKEGTVLTGAKSGVADHIEQANRHHRQC